MIPRDNIAPPFSLVAELTYRCPLQCPYCSNPLNWSSDKYRTELATEDWLRIIQQARQIGVLQLGFTGGEPLLRKDLEILVEVAANLGLYTTLVTAGTLLTKERASTLHSNRLDHIQISLQDSRAPESDYIAGTPSFNQKIAAARLVKELGFPLTLNVVLHRQNLDRIEEIIELAETLQADRIELANTQYYGWALKNRAALLPTREQLEHAERIVKAAQQRRKIPMGILYVIPDYYDKYPKPCMGGWGKRTLIIAPNGDGLPCQAAMSIPHLTFANAHEHSLEYIWYDSEAMNAYRGAAWMPELCQNCERKEIDWGGCRCQAYLLTQDSTATDPVCHLSPQHSQILAIREEVSSNSQLDFAYRGAK